jgi:hypothetical protein
MLPAGGRPATSWGVHYTTSCNTQSSAPEDGQNNCAKHAELTGIINKPLLLHVVGCPYYLYQWWTVKKISDNEIYWLIKYIKSVFWTVAKRLFYIEDARCLKVNPVYVLTSYPSHLAFFSQLSLLLLLVFTSDLFLTVLEKRMYCPFIFCIGYAALLAHKILQNLV